jgi:hypothetical protein
MASRKEEKERRRREREQREAEAAAQAARRSRRRRVAIGAASIALVGVVVALALAGGGGDGDATKGLQETPGPWQPVSEGLKEREEALDLPAPSDTIYHVHAQLKVYANGKQLKVPNNIGVEEGSGFHSSLHTHDEKGTVHMEAVEPYPFTPEQFFTVWGVKFTRTQLGAFRIGNGLLLEAYANGEKIDPTKYGMKQGDAVVVAFGKPGSAPKTFKPDTSVTAQ